jgi:hypothetical protein
MSDKPSDPHANDPIHGAPPEPGRGGKDAIRLPAGAHLDIPGTTHFDQSLVPHIDAPPAHMDFGMHLDTATAGGGHADIAGGHTDSALTQHIDLPPVHGDTPAPQHVDVKG